MITQALPAASTTQRFVVCSVGPPAVERSREQARKDEGPARRRHTVQPGKGRQRVGELREPTARLDPDTRVGDLGRLGPLDPVGGQVLLG